MDNFKKEWAELKEKIIEFRHKLHQYPETAFEEYQTQKLILEILKANGISDVKEAAKTGVIATIKGKENGPVVALRADMDALKIKEETNLSYQSNREGYMHACGHDAHMAIVMGTLLYLKRLSENWDGSIKCIFQPAEEKIGGAKPLIADGVLTGVSKIVALHLWPGLPEGTIGIKDGVFMASNDYFKVEVTGKGAHGAKPDEGVDALDVGIKILAELKGILLREVSPLKRAVISVGKFNAGKIYNIIPETCQFEGTVRTLDTEVREYLAHRIPEVCQEYPKLYGAEAKIEYLQQYPVTINNPEVNQAIFQAAGNLFGQGEVVVLTEPSLVAEDFSFYTEKIPGAMFLLGTHSDEKGYTYPLHHSKFAYDEEVVLEKGIRLMSEVALRLVNQGGER